VLGNVGTYDLMSFTAIGTTVNLGARLEAEATPGSPCISRKTYEEVRGRFRYAEGCLRMVKLKELEELGEQPVWDVVGKAPETPIARVVQSDPPPTDPAGMGEGT
jgi:class 3 adenylate cyclase